MQKIKTHKKNIHDIDIVVTMTVFLYLKYIRISKKKTIFFAQQTAKNNLRYMHYRFDAKKRKIFYKEDEFVHTEILKINFFFIRYRNKFLNQIIKNSVQ